MSIHQPAAGGRVGALDALDDALDVAGTLAAAGEIVADRHAVEVRALEVDLHFAALHSAEPPLTAGELGGNRLVQLGGDGTPMVQDLPICELAIAKKIHEYSARNQVADALDLAFRMPRTWAELRAGRGWVWVARRVAKTSRHLDRKQVRAVDAAVAAALDESPGRVLNLAEAAIDRADPEHARLKEEEKRRRRCLVIGRSDEDGLRTIFGRIDAGDAAWMDAMVERVADALETRPDLIHDLAVRATESGSGYTREELRAEAFGWLAHPEDVIALLNGSYPVQGDADLRGTEGRANRQRAVVFVHLSQAAVEALLTGGSPDLVARVEDLGPMLADQLRRLLGHAHVDLKPVIDLNRGRSVNQYEHPADVKERGFLRTTGDVFPHAQSQSRQLDGDHPDTYKAHGPPGQTGDHNHAPLGRRHHRAKTHLRYDVVQIGPNSYVWRTPHGLHRLVDGAGTHVIDEVTAERLTSSARFVPRS